MPIDYRLTEIAVCVAGLRVAAGGLEGLLGYWRAVWGLKLETAVLPLVGLVRTD
ncbi:MAG: hypothetical protein R6X32_05275 [Chloroflexota bacterium]